MATENANIHVIDSKEAWLVKLEDSVKQKKNIVVDFTAIWCAPCRLVAPIFEELSKRHSNLLFVKIDVDEFQEIASEWEVRAMPTFIFVKDGKLVDKLVGANQVELQRKVQEFAREAPSTDLPPQSLEHLAHHEQLVAHVQA